MDKEIRCVVIRGEGWGKVKLDEGSQEGNTPIYKMNKY